MYGKNDFEKIKNILVKNIPNLRYVFLFGSYASGQATNDSDIDIAIVVKKELARKQKLQLLNKLWNETGDDGSA